MIRDGENKKTKTIGLIDKQLYYDKTLIGEKIDNFSIRSDYEESEGKIKYTIDLDVKIGEETYSHTYTPIIE